MKKAYLISDEHYNCLHSVYQPYGQDQGLITLGYALIIIDAWNAKEKYNTFIRQTNKMQESFDLRCCDSPEMQVVFTRSGKDFLLELQYGWYERVDGDGSESDIFHKEEPKVQEFWTESQEWIKREPEKEDSSIKIDQTAFINLAHEFIQINNKGLVLELIQNEDESFSFFLSK